MRDVIIRGLPDSTRVLVLEPRIRLCRTSRDAINRELNRVALRFSDEFARFAQGPSAKVAFGLLLSVICRPVHFNARSISSGAATLRSANAPATCGVAIDVSLLFVRTFLPPHSGAKVVLTLALLARGTFTCQRPSLTAMIALSDQFERNFGS